MPNSDVMIKYAIKRACLGRSRKIIVVNPDEMVRERYQRLLGHIDFHKIGFVELIQSDYFKRIVGPR